jgi:uncharacterized membrane protein YgcG
MRSAWFAFLGAIFPIQLLCNVGVFAERSPSLIANPMKDPRSCGRPDVDRSAICDPDNLLSKESKDTVDTLMNSIEEAEVAVAIIEKMSPAFVQEYNSDIDVACENFARKLHDIWGIGNAVKQNGLLFFLSIKDRAMYISRGQGLENRFTDRVLEIIIENMKYPLKKGQYGHAVEQGVTDTILIIQGKASNVTFWSDVGTYLTWLVMGVFFSLVGYISYTSWSSGRELRRGEAAMKALMDDIDKMSKDEFYESSTCPVCLEDFDLENPARKSTGLRCGHLFCHGCVKELLKSSTALCPICRIPIDKNSTGNTQPPLQARRDPYRDDNITQDSGGGGCAGEFHTAGIPQRHLPTLRFRFNNMRMNYPNYLDVATAREMTNILDSGGSVAEMRRLYEARATVVASILAKAKAAGSRSGASRSGFGGGRSSGGRGGRW